MLLRKGAKRPGRKPIIRSRVYCPQFPQKGVTAAVEMMSASIDLVVNGFEIVHDADNRFHSIAETVMAINKKSVAISTAASQQLPTLESKAASIYS